MVRSGLRMLLDMETDLEVVAEAGDVAATTACLPERAPDVLIRDVHLGTENGLDAMASLLDASPATGVLVLTMQDDPAFARKALRAGHDLAHHARLTELDGQQPGQARDDHDDRDGDEERGDQRAERLILARRREALARRTQPGRGREHRLGASSPDAAAGAGALPAAGLAGVASSSGSSWTLLRLRSTARALSSTWPPRVQRTSPVRAPVFES